MGKNLITRTLANRIRFWKKIKKGRDFYETSRKNYT